MMMKTKTLWFVVVTGLVAAAPPAAAQIVAPTEPAQIAFGPVSLYPSLQIVDAGVDDNVFNDGASPERDYTATVASRVLAVVRLGSNELLFRTGNDYMWFQRFGSERSSNAQYGVRFNLTASRFKPFIGAERVRTRARRSPEIDARARRLDRTALAGLGFDLTPRTSLTASARMDDTTYDQGERYRGVTLSDALNRTGRGADAGVRYAITPLTTIAVTAGYEEQTFKESHIRDVTRYTLGPTVEFSPEAAIHGRVVTAFELFRPEDPALAETKGLAYEAVLNWSLYGRTTFDFGAGRNISYSYQDAEPFYRLTSVRFLVTQPVSDRFELYASGDWEHMGYQWRRDPLADETYRVDILQTGSAGVGIHLGHGFRVKLGIEKARRKSVEDPLQNFTRTRMLSTVTVGS